MKASLKISCLDFNPNLTTKHSNRIFSYYGVFKCCCRGREFIAVITKSKPSFFTISQLWCFEIIKNKIKDISINETMISKAQNNVGLISFKKCNFLPAVEARQTMIKNQGWLFPLSILDFNRLKRETEVKMYKLIYRYVGYLLLSIKWYINERKLLYEILHGNRKHWKFADIGVNYKSPAYYIITSLIIYSV